MFTNRRNLGLAVTEQGITAVEVGISGGRRTVLHAAVLPFSKGAGLGEPERLGKDLKQVLRQNGFSAPRCVIGLASNWIAAREKPLPATNADSLRGALSIAAEREFASGPHELVLDYLRSTSEKGISAILVAAPRRVVGQLSAMAKAAGLSATAVTSSATVLATATRGPVGPGGRLVLCLLPRAVEMTAQSPNGVRMIRHLPVGLDGGHVQVDSLSSELRRILAGQADHSRELLIWDSLGLDRASLESVGDDLGLPLRLCELASDLDVADSSSGPMSGRFAQAAALACCAGQAPAIDFLHSRLAPPRRAALGRWALWAAAACLVVVAAGLFLVLDWRADLRKVTDIQNQLADLKGPTQQARELVDDTSFAGTWYDRRPGFLDCLREITQAFPQEGTIWATSLAVREDMQVRLTGKAVSEAAGYQLFDRLKASPRLANITPLFVSRPGGTSREVSFSVSLSFRGVD